MQNEKVRSISAGKVLIIDTDRQSQSYMADILTKVGHHVRIVSDARMGISSARSEIPDLILLDAHLPDINGVETCRLLRSQPETEYVPIIFVSALDATNLKALALAAGGTDYITKPIDPVIFRERVRAQIDLQQLRNRLNAKEKMFRMTFEFAPIGIAHVALDGGWLEINDYLCKLLGYPKAELKHKGFQDITHPDDLDTDIAFVNQMLEQKIDKYTIKKRYFHKDGSIIWAQLTVRLVLTEDGKPEYFISVIEDLSDNR